jgi:hypothetical protein
LLGLNLVNNSFCLLASCALQKFYLVRIIPWWRYHVQIIILSDTFIFQTFLLLMTSASKCTNA